MSRTTLAVIVGNRDFFPDRLVTEGRGDILSLFSEMDIEPVILGENDTKLGAVETWGHARRCADLFRANFRLHWTSRQRCRCYDWPARTGSWCLDLRLCCWRRPIR